MRRMTWLLALLVSAVAPAFAEDAPPGQNARLHYQRGTALFNLGEFADAAAEYKEAYKVLPEPVFLYNIAQAYRLAGDLQKASFFYTSYAHNATDPATKHEAEARAKKLEERIAAHKGEPEPKKTETAATGTGSAGTGSGSAGTETKSGSGSETGTGTKTEVKSSPLIAEPIDVAAADSPGPEWAGGSERLSSMTDLIKTHRDQFRFCYDAWSKKHPKIEGHLKLILTIAPDGKLQMTEAHAGGVQAPELERCVTAMSKQLTYPPSQNGKMTRFTYPFEFKYHP